MLRRVVIGGETMRLATFNERGEVILEAADFIDTMRKGTILIPSCLQPLRILLQSHFPSPAHDGADGAAHIDGYILVGVDRK